MPTIREVAREAGVSIASVSRVLNNPEVVSPETRARVEKAINKLDYRPNLLGRNLRRSETRMILIILPTISNSFYTEIIKGIEDRMHFDDYYVMVTNTDGEMEREKIYFDLLKNRLVDGVVVFGPVLSSQELTEIARQFPVVQCCEYIEKATVSRVSIDNIKAASTATNHLINCGYRRIAMISGHPDLFSSIHREQGYKKALEEAGLQFSPELIKYGSYGYKGGLRAASEFLIMDEKPDAIFAISDMMAIGAIRAIKESGLKVPDDIGVMGFDNIEISAIFEPRLTTISQPRYDLGKITADLILQMIETKENIVKEIYLEHELLIRESTIQN